MLKHMTLRKLGQSTPTGNIRAVLEFARYFGQSADTATAADLRLFQLYSVEQGTLSIITSATLTGNQVS